jgi:hypothetical protein
MSSISRHVGDRVLSVPTYLCHGCQRQILDEALAQTSDDTHLNYCALCKQKLTSEAALGALELASHGKQSTSAYQSDLENSTTTHATFVIPLSPTVSVHTASAGSAPCPMDTAVTGSSPTAPATVSVALDLATLVGNYAQIVDDMKLLKDEQALLKRSNLTLQEQNAKLAQQHTEDIKKLNSELKPLVCSDFVIKLADLLQKLLRPKLQQLFDITIGPHESVFTQVVPDGEWHKRVDLDAGPTKKLFNYLRIVSQMRNTVAHSFQFAQPDVERWRERQFVPWTEFIKQLRDSNECGQLDNLKAFSDRGIVKNSKSDYQDCSGEELARGALSTAFDFITKESAVLSNMDPGQIAQADWDFLLHGQSKSSCSSK